jgi:hypothetical protein
MRASSYDHRGKTKASANQRSLWTAAGGKRHPPAQQVHRNPARETRDQEEATQPEFKDLQVHHRGHRVEGVDKGELRKVCTEVN